MATTSRGGRVAVIAVICAVALGCSRRSSAPSGGGGGAPGAESGGGETETAAGGETTGDDAPTGKDEWADRIREQLEEAPEASPVGSDAPSRAVGCRLFPDSCGGGKSCFVQPSGLRGCAPFEPEKSVGDACTPGEDRCNAGQQCVGGTSPVCLQTCRPGSSPLFGCPEDWICTPVVGPEDEPFDWGVCRPVEDRCRSWPNDNCTLGEACVRTPGGRRCRDYRETADLGAACTQPSDCRIGQVCVVGPSGLGACRARCDDEQPCREAECRPLEGRDVGYCPGTSGREPEESEGPSIIGY